MKDNTKINSHYLSICYKALINKNIIHFILILIEISLLFLQMFEVYYNNYNSLNITNELIFSPLTFLQIEIDKLSDVIKVIIYPIIILIIIINSYIFNNYRLKINIITIVMINISEIFFYRLFSLPIFNYLFSLKGIYLIILVFITIPYILILILNFSQNHLFLFFPSLISYPYDLFSMIIDLHLLFVKLFISLAGMNSDRNISIFSFFLSIFFLLILFLYLSYLMIYKSYYLMNNSILNNARYSLLLTIFISIIITLIFDKNGFHIYFIIIFLNIFIICLIFICYFYDPYKFAKFDKDNNIENIFYYFFMFDRDKNQYFLIEEKIEEHMSKCNMCNLCKKYNNIKNKNNKNQVDLYRIIYNGNNSYIFNLMNIIIRRIKKNGKKSFINNSYYLINIIYTFYMEIDKRNFNTLLNIELIFEIINSENKSFLEENKICLERILYTNDFFIKAKKVIDDIYDIFEEKRLNKNIPNFIKLGGEIEKLKYNEIKSNLQNNWGNTNNNGNNLEGLPNCNNLLTICSLFYEEFFNETISNSGISIRENPNLLEDLINNNFKSNKQITLEINIKNFEVKIIRAGGKINKYENKNFFDIFLNICKNSQIFEMKKVLLNSNANSDSKIKTNKKKPQIKAIEKEKQYLNFTFLIEEKENNDIFCRILKLKLSLILLTHLDNKIYLNGIYVINNDIILTEENKNEELLIYFGNKKRIKNYISKYNIINNKIVIRKIKNEKFLGYERLVNSINFTIGSKVYNIYHFLIPKKKSIYEVTNINSQQINNFEEEKMNLLNKINNNTFIFNDLASHASSGNNSVARNTLVSYNRENKKIHKNENETKELKIIKYILLLIIVIFLSIIIFFSLFLNTSYKNLEKATNFYLSFRDYSFIFHNLFFSVLSLGCIALSNNTTDCKNFLSDLPTIIIKSFMDKYLDIQLIYEDDFYLFDFSKFLFYQNTLFIEDLNNRLNILIKKLTKIDENLLLEFNEGVLHFKISQNYDNNKIVLNLNQESITFNDFNLLMISRFSSLSNDYKNIKDPIYILNKTGEGVFNNIYLTDKLNSYQENFYLIILDFKIYTDNLNFFLEEVGNKATHSKINFKYLIYTFLNLILFFVITIFLMLFLLMYIYLFIIFKTLSKINNELKEKINDLTIKELMKMKMDSLKCLLNFYEIDINRTINNLNKIYDDYRDNYNLKLKEELKLLKREGKKEIEKVNKNSNCIFLLSKVKKYKLYSYAVKKKNYLYILLFIIIITISAYIANLFIWILVFNKDKKFLERKKINDRVITATNKLISNYLLMIYNNQTLEEISMDYDSKDFISYIYNELTPLYSIKKYDKIIDKTILINELENNYNCTDFYYNLDNEFFTQIKSKFIDEEKQLIGALGFLCNWSEVFSFNNYNSLYLQLFNIVQKGMENFNNIKYEDIIKFIQNKEVIRIDLIYITIYAYLIDIMIKNNKKLIILMCDQIGYYMIITNVIIYPFIIFLIFITFYIYVRNVNNECKKFIQIRKIFKVCNTN